MTCSHVYANVSQAAIEGVTACSPEVGECRTETEHG